MKNIILICLAISMLSVSLRGQHSIKLYPVIQNHKIGYIDGTGSIVINPDLDFTNFDYPVEAASGLGFFNGLASVKLNGKFGYIDTAGKFVVEPQFEYAAPFSEGLAYIRSGNRTGYINTTGQIVIKTESTYRYSAFSEGLATVGLGTDNNPKCGYMDKTGRMVINARFSTCGDFSEGLASVSIFGSGTSYINQKGEVLFKLKGYATGEQFSEGLAKVWTSNAKIGFINQNRKVVIEPLFGYAKNFSEGLAVVTLNHKWGFIDKSGNIVISPQYVYADDFSEGLAPVCINDPSGNGQQRLCGYIDKSGKMVIPMQFRVAYKFHDGLALVAVGDINNRQWGYIDQTGKYVWNPTK